MASFKIMTIKNVIGTVKDFNHMSRSEAAQYVTELELAKQEVLKIFENLT